MRGLAPAAARRAGEGAGRRRRGGFPGSGRRGREGSARRAGGWGRCARVSWEGGGAGLEEGAAGMKVMRSRGRGPGEKANQPPTHHATKATKRNTSGASQAGTQGTSEEGRAHGPCGRGARTHR